ncbi:SPOR domain-containing protein [Altererythrobacter sp. MTPC7]|uniref:SPOR domain-containing protein n=1 Tax=Altererythrobacter sp. MTPC7 TaxID=3056567 RepID=UPI0036F3823C
MFGGEKDSGEEEYTTAHEAMRDDDADWTGAEDETDGLAEEGIIEDDADDDRLNLDGDDEALPWLESSDYAEEEGVDTGRLVGFVLLGLLALGLLVGGIWFLTNRGPDPELVADGSTIEAPEGDYKRRPDDAGGREFPGTGDVAPAVGEGQTREGRLAEGSTSGEGEGAARPSANAPSAGDTGSSANASGGNDNSGSAGTASSGSASGPGVQVGAYSTRSAAEAGWQQLGRQTDALSGVRYRIVEGTADIGTVFRLQATPGDMAAANRLCTALKADGLACQVKP